MAVADDDDDRPRRRRDEDEDDDDDPRSRRRRDDEDYRDRPRRRPAANTGNGPAMASLVLGILSFCLSGLTGIPAIICGFIGLSKANKTGNGQGMAIAGLVLGLAGTALSAVGFYYAFKQTKKGFEKIVDTVQSVQDMGNMTEIGKGMHQHMDRNNSFPAASVTANDQPGPALRSWRFEILPYIGEQQLHSRFDQTLPWNHANNKQVSDTPVRVYWPPDQISTTQTRYRVFTGPKTPFPKPGQKSNIATFQDGMSSTFLVVESGQLGPWAEPRDIDMSVLGFPALGKPNVDRFVVVMADGSVKYVRKNLDIVVLRQLIDPTDGNIIQEGWDQ